ncbi:MAG TPA: hypothetical protein PKA10_10880 [Selenomonadales bacterium]|nr:hypothetical protein [Selenomonadales bacterium]
MPVEVFILGTLGFAVCGAVLYVWGYRRSRRMPQALQRQMGQLLEQKILAVLAECPEGATLKNLAGAIKNARIGNQLQGYRLAVDNHLVAAEAVVQRMVARGLVREAVAGQTKRYFCIPRP